MFLKERTVLPTILFLAVVVLLVLAFTSNTYVPYSNNDLFKEYSEYEGFEEGFDEGFEEAFDEGFDEAFEEALDDKPITYEDKPPSSNSLMPTLGIPQTTLPNVGSSKDKDNNTNTTGKLGFSSMSEPFENMYDPVKWGYAPLNMKEDMDKFGDSVHLPNSGKCVSAGLFTSHGPLCLTPELKKLLETRGDNM